MVTDKTKKTENPNQHLKGRVFMYAGSQNWEVEKVLKDGTLFCRSLESRSCTTYIYNHQIETLKWLNCNLNGVWYVNGIKQN